jgi:two-component system chemotaxis response regulator CheB
VRITRGPRENRWRPAIDPLFRSAAVAYGTRTIGVVMSGMLDDGTAGLLAIKRCGGIAIVQDPEEAAFPDMPRSALANVEVDYCLPVGAMGTVIRRLIEEPAPHAAGAAARSRNRSAYHRVRLQQPGRRISDGRAYGAELP